MNLELNRLSFQLKFTEKYLILNSKQWNSLIIQRPPIMMKYDQGIEKSKKFNQTDSKEF